MLESTLISTLHNTANTALWNRFWCVLQPTPTTEENGLRWREELIARYSEPHRAYHTMQHLQECLDLLVDNLSWIPQPEFIFFALWYHDAIYDVHSHQNINTNINTNENNSAELAATHLSKSGIDANKIQKITDLICITAHDKTPMTIEEKIIVDIDLAILGADEKRFLEYEQQIRKEYGFVPEAIFQTKRRAILQSFLERPRIYHTPQFFERLESSARYNLGRCIKLA